MDNWEELRADCEQLLKAVDHLGSQMQNGGSSDLSSSDRASDTRGARRKALDLLDRIATSLRGPDEFIQGLSQGYQLLACLQWLVQFHVLGYIPLTGTAQSTDIADLVGVPEVVLSRIVRVAAAAGFLAEPQPGHIAHTALSAPFVKDTAHVETIAFLANTAAPAASCMTAATVQYQQMRMYHDGRSSAYSLASKSSSSFDADCRQRPKLYRRYDSYIRCISQADHEMDDEDAVKLLLQLDWQALSNARVVIVNATSTKILEALSTSYPTLRFVVQTAQVEGIRRGDGEQVENQSISVRIPGSPQLVEDAAVYILQVPRFVHPTVHSEDQSLDPWLQAELWAHFGLLGKNPSATLILIPRVYPEPGSVETAVENAARLVDLTKMQLSNERQYDLRELEAALSTVRDNVGRLVVVNRMTLRSTTMVALGIKYQRPG
ncbi:O-methyltransferase family protein [Nemania sp. NC0429]|nr:O-methyltransferase family protein [Nemania sp. NC0429]